MTKYKVGDEFKVIGNSKNKNGKHCFEIGEIVELRWHHDKRDGSGKVSKKYGEFVGRNNQVAESYQTVKFKDLEYQYKVGDKVEIIDNTCRHQFKIGDVVEIVKTYSSFGADSFRASDGVDCWVVDGDDIKLA